MINEITFSSMKSKIFFVVALALFLAGCGGGGGSTVTPESAIRTGYAVDDYVIGGTVKIYSGSTDSVLYETTTADKGTFSWPTNLSGAIRVEISGGKEDVDGLSSTVEDQKPFDGKLVAIYFAEKQGSPVIVSAVTTGLAIASKNEISSYEDLKANLPDDVIKNFFTASSDNQLDIDKKLEVVKKVQRTMSMSSIINELSDDGKINNSNGISSSALTSPIAMAGSALSSGIEDLALQYCIAEQLGKDPASIKQADLSQITTLNCEGANVLSLNGIQSLVNVESLTLNNNEISDARPLQTLTKLYYLNLNNNKIKGLGDFGNSQFLDVSLDIGNNCISDTSTIVDTAKIKVTQYAGNKRQFPNCVKNDANVKRMLARISGTGAYVLVYITDLNTLANCQIDWGDGSVEQSYCDAKSHTVQHNYSSPPSNPVKFLVNGVVKSQASFPGSQGSIEVRPIAFQNINNGSTFYQTGIVAWIPRLPSSYDSATVQGAGITGVATLTDTGSGSTLQNPGYGDVVQFDSNFTSGSAPAGTPYTVKLYKQGVLVSSRVFTLSGAVLATSEMSPSMFPSMTLTAYADLCPGGSNATASYYSIPSSLPNGPQARLTCTATTASAEVESGDSLGRRFDTVYYIGDIFATVGAYDKLECVRDKRTGLLWEGKRSTGYRAGDKKFTNFDNLNEAQKFNYNTALYEKPTSADINSATNTVGYAIGANGDTICGMSGWRVPTQSELVTLFNRGQNSNWNTVFSSWFPNSYTNGYYWSSTGGVTSQGLPGAYAIGFSGNTFLSTRGSINAYDPTTLTDTHYLRLVHD